MFSPFLIDESISDDGWSLVATPSVGSCDNGRSDMHMNGGRFYR